MTRDEIWAEAGDVEGVLCVGCLEERLGRVLTPEDFLPLPVNDDDELDSVRLRTRKGSGRAVEALYRIATGAVLDLGVGSEALAEGLGIDGRVLEVRVDSANVAEVLELDGRLLAIRVDQARFSRRALAEIEADEMPEAALARRLAVGMADGLMREGP